MVVVFPGPEPVTRQQREMCIASGTEIKFYPKEIKDMDKRAILLVVACNGAGYYSPTVPLTDHQTNDWRKEALVKVLKVGLGYVHDIDQSISSEAEKAKLQVLDYELSESIKVFSSRKHQRKNVKDVDEIRKRKASKPLLSRPSTPKQILSQPGGSGQKEADANAAIEEDLISKGLWEYGQKTAMEGL